MLKLLCIFVVVIRLNSGLTTPVLIWGAKCPSKPALQTMKQMEFFNVALALLEQHMIVALLEPQLSTRDFLCRNVKTTRSCYEHLRTVTPSTYYANVENPVAAMSTLNVTTTSNSVTDLGRLQFRATCHVGTVQLVTLSTIFPESRELTLQMHDQQIKSMQMSYFKQCPVVFMYMSASATTVAVRVPCQPRYKRSTVDEEKEDGKIRNALRGKAGAGKLFQRGRLSIYFKKITVNKLSGGGVIEELQATTMETDVVAGEGIYVELDLKNQKNVSFLVELTNTQYTIKLFQYDSNVFRVSYLTAPRKFSYTCRAVKAYNTDAEVLTLHKFQMEVFRDEIPKNTVARFSKCWHCDGWVSSGLLMAYFVCALLLAILCLGICMIMDIQINYKITPQRRM